MRPPRKATARDCQGHFAAGLSAPQSSRLRSDVRASRLGELVEEPGDTVVAGGDAEAADSQSPELAVSRMSLSPYRDGGKTVHLGGTREGSGGSTRKCRLEPSQSAIDRRDEMTNGVHWPSGFGLRSTRRRSVVFAVLGQTVLHRHAALEESEPLASTRLERVWEPVELGLV